MKEISKKQQDIINYINDYKKEKNKLPYTTEIAHHFNKSNSAISGMLKRLKDKGLLEYDNHYNAKIYNSKKCTLERLQQENQQLKAEISDREEENKKLKDNWNKLKEYAKDNLYFYSGYQGEDLETDIAIQGVLNKMKELEGIINDDNRR